VLNELSFKINQLFTLCDMNNPRFYKYQANLLGTLANYLQHSFSNTTQYLAIDMFFPVLLLMKRQILELSHPFLDNLDRQAKTLSKQFSKKEKQDSNRKANKV
jgi:hypothetical protein